MTNSVSITVVPDIITPTIAMTVGLTLARNCGGPS